MSMADDFKLLTWNLEGLGNSKKKHKTILRFSKEEGDKIFLFVFEEHNTNNTIFIFIISWEITPLPFGANIPSF